MFARCAVGVAQIYQSTGTGAGTGAGTGTVPVHSSSPTRPNLQKYVARSRWSVTVTLTVSLIHPDLVHCFTRNVIYVTVSVVLGPGEHVRPSTCITLHTHYWKRAW